MRKKLGWIAMLLAMCVMNGWACTNLIVGKKASADGSVIVSYSADSYGMFGFLCHYPAMTHESGAMRPIYEWDTGKYLGQIKEAKQTYNVIGNMNEFQVTIGETTFGGRPELVDWRTPRTGRYNRNHGLWKPDLCGAPALSHGKRSH